METRTHVQEGEPPLVFFEPDGRPDVDVSQLSACTCRSMDECEEKCARYATCDTVALCDDILREFERLCARYGESKATRMF